MNKRQAKKRKQRELWINWCGERFKLPLLMKWKDAKKLKSIDRKVNSPKTLSSNGEYLESISRKVNEVTKND